MQIICRIKKALKIASPAPYEYCYLKLNPKNKKRCLKCKYFKISEYTAYNIGVSITNAMQKAVQAINNMSNGINKALEELQRSEK